MDRRSGGKGTFTLVFCGLMAALGTGLMAAGGALVILTYCAPLAAGLLLVPVIREYGRRWAFLVWLVTALLSLILCPDREAAFFYLFLGYYPILKGTADRVKPPLLGWAVKLLFFLLMLGLMYGFIHFALGLDLGLEEWKTMGKLAGIGSFLLLAATMLVYDVALKSVAFLYERRVRPKIPFLK